jgi:SAM-dependent methyltransferase
MTAQRAEQTNSPIHFDDYAHDYDAALNRGLSATGESKDYFARGRVCWLTRCLQELGEQPTLVMDFGCGDGSTSTFLLTMAQSGSVIGVDTSDRSLELATRHYAGERASFISIGQYQPKAEIDLAYCSGVFHHIPLHERTVAVEYIWRSLRPGALFSLWENNPWNPGARYVMSRIPFDRDAIMLSPPEAANLLHAGGFEILRRDSLFYFPKPLKCLRWIEPYLSGLSLGGQFHLLCRKPRV